MSVEVIPSDRVEVLDADDMLPVVAQANPFTKDAKVFYAPPGVTVAEAVAQIAMPAAYAPYVGVWINDTRISPVDWERTVVKAGDTVYLRVLPAGGKGGKDIFRAIAMVVIAVVAVAVAGPLASAWLPAGFSAGAAGLGGIGFGIVQGLIGAGITMLGYMALNAIIPPPGLQQQTQDDPRFRLTGTQNTFKPYANIPRIFGKRRTFPLHAARPYSEMQGDDEYLRICLVVGWGPLEITNIKIGETPIDAFDGVEYEIREGWDTDQPLTLFTKTVVQNDFSIQLEPPGTTGYYPPEETPGYRLTRYLFKGQLDDYSEVTAPDVASNTWVTRTTETNAAEFSVDTAHPQGLFYIDNKGRRQQATVTTEVQYRLVGSSGSWTPAAWANNFDDGFNVAGVITTKNNDTTSVRRSGRCVLPAVGQYDVRVRRTNNNSLPDSQFVDMTLWTCLRTIKAEYPVLQKGLTLIAIRMKATGQLNGVPASINCEAESYLPIWNGSTWTFTKSSNPAWAYADVLRRRANQQFMADDRIDLAGISAWATACATTAPNASEPYWTYNAVHEGGSVIDTLKQIAASARASYTLKDGKHSVVRDVSQTTPIMHITPRNSWGYSGSKAFVKFPHALRVTFPNKDKGWERDEVVVYYDGYNQSNATEFETLPMDGCTSATQAWRDGRYVMAAARLRPEVHTVHMDIENLRGTKGDLVRFTHDAVAIGVQASRVRTINTSGGNVTGVVLDDDCYFEVGTNYSLRVRKADGSSVVLALNNPGTGFATSLTFSSPPTIANGPVAGDLAMFGITNAETAPMIIKDIVPDSDFSATVYLVDAQPGVWTADTGTIPPFNSYITLPSIQDAASLPGVYIESVRSDDSVTVIQEDGSIMYRIAVQLQQPASSTARVDYFEVQWKEKQSSGGWQTVRVERASPYTYLFPVVVGNTYQLRSRGVSNTNDATEWSPIIEHVANGKDQPPGLPTAISATAIPGGIRVQWTNPEDDDLWQIEVWENTTNNSGTATLVATSANRIFNRLGLTSASGVRYYWLKAVDTSGNHSAFTAVVSATAANMGLSIRLSNESVTLAAASDGTVSSFATAVGQMTVFDGDTDVTAAATLTTLTQTNCTGSVNTALNTPVTGAKGSYRVTAMTDDNAELIMRAVYNGTTIERSFSLAKARAGVGGSATSSALVFLYQRATSAPAVPAGTTTYTFASGALSAPGGGWSQTIPAGTNPIYVTVASAVGTGTTDTIATGEWATPVVLAQNGNPGADGTSGASAATVFLFQRTTGATPSVPSTTSTYNFGTGALTGHNNGWSQSMPTSGGAYRWMITATALAAVGASTDNISSGEWSTPAIMGQDGTNGTNGTNGTPAVWLDMSNNATQLFAYADGSVPDFSAAVGRLLVYEGGTDVTASATLSASASGCTGTINTATNTPVSGQPKGYYRVTAMSADTATLVLSAVYNGITYTTTLSLSKTKTGYEIVGSLPVSNLFEGRIVYLNTDDKIYRYTGSVWTVGFAAGDLTGTISAAQIGALQVQTVHLQAGAVTAAKIAVTQLSAISADLGSINAGSLNIGSGKFQVASDGTVTIQNASIGQRLVITNSVLEVYDASNIRRVRLGIW